MYNRQLEVLIAVADCGSFSKAGEKLFISPTAVMKQMNLLEKRLGLTLLRRTNQGVCLTQAGQSIYTDSKFLIDYAKGALKRAGALERDRYTLRVGTSLLNPIGLFMDLWNRVNDIHPQFRMELVPFEDDHRSILATLNSVGERFDLIVAACNSAQWLRRCCFLELGRYNICFAAPKGHRLADKAELTLDDLHGERLMMIREGDSPIIDSIRDEIVALHPQIQIEDTPSFYDAGVFNRCEQMGCILLTLDGWSEIHPALTTIPAKWERTMPYGLLYSRRPSEGVTKFLNAVKELTLHEHGSAIFPEGSPLP